jgi:hypothetical protein
MKNFNKIIQYNIKIEYDNKLNLYYYNINKESLCILLNIDDNFYNTYFINYDDKSYIKT